jgi:hypothetical protein
MKRIIEKLELMNEEIDVLIFVNEIEMILDVAEIKGLITADDFKMIVEQLNDSKVTAVDKMLVELFKENEAELLSLYNEDMSEYIIDCVGSEMPAYVNAAHSLKNKLNVKKYFEDMIYDFCVGNDNEYDEGTLMSFIYEEIEKGDTDLYDEKDVNMFFEVRKYIINKGGEVKFMSDETEYRFKVVNEKDIECSWIEKKIK